MPGSPAIARVILRVSWGEHRQADSDLPLDPGVAAAGTEDERLGLGQGGSSCGWTPACASFSGTSMSTPQSQGSPPVADPGCPACGQAILPGTAVGGTKHEMLHLGCFLARRDAAKVIALISRRPCCVPCLIDRTGCTASALVEILGRLATSIVVESGPGTCEICERPGHVFSILRPPLVRAPQRGSEPRARS